MHLRTRKKTYPTIVQVNIPGAGTVNVQCTNSTSMQKSLLWLDTYLVPAQTDFITQDIFCPLRGLNVI